jgi:hypothetical protein
MRRRAPPPSGGRQLQGLGREREEQPDSVTPVHLGQALDGGEEQRTEVRAVSTIARRAVRLVG